MAQTSAAMDIDEVLTAPRSPWQHAHVERFIGSVRRQCLDHTIVFSAVGLGRLMVKYCRYYERSRTHLSLDKDATIPRAGERGQYCRHPASRRLPSPVRTADGLS
jgi:transposase InsO family protein